MDKYEYKLKTEQMLELMGDNAYNKAAEIADSIDWKRVRNTTMLSTVSEIYEKNRDFQKSYEVLRIAYDRAEGSRKIVSRLCTLALKTRNVDEAIDYYDDFIEIAPKDPNQYILKYQILRAQRSPIEQQIHALEEFKKAEYIEEWAYELAKLYQEAGMTAECLEECDDLILWFSEGQYVYRAMELKMQYKPLTPSQQEKYDRRYEKASSETEEIPSITEYQQKGAGAEDSEKEEVDQLQANGEARQQASESTQDTAAEEQKTEVPKRKIGNTMKLDEALKSLLNIKLKTDEDEPEEKHGTEESDLRELESEIEEIESVADIGFAEKLAEEKQKKAVVVDPDLEELVPEPVEEEIQEEESVPETEAGLEQNGENEQESKSAEAEKSVKAVDQITGQMSLMDLLDNLEVSQEEKSVAEEAEERSFEEDSSEILEKEDAEEFSEEIFTEDAEEFIEDAGEFAENAEEPEKSERSEQAAEERDSMEDNKKEKPILSPDIQRLIDEIEGNIPPQEETVSEVWDEEYAEEPIENKGDEAEELRIEDNSEEFEDYDDILDDDEYEEYEEDEEEEGFTWGAEDAVDAEEAETFSGVFDESYEEVSDEELSEEELTEEFAEEYEEYEDEQASVERSIEEEFRPQEHYDEVDDREIPDEEEDEIDLLSATTPLSRKETAKLIATGKTAPLPLDEISGALSMSDTGFVVHGRYDLKMQSGIGTRAGLTEEQKKLFSYFVPVRGMSEQLVDVLEQDKNCTNRKGTSCTGNLLIIGNKGNGKTVLAVDVVKAIQKQRKIRQGKVAIVTGDSLNKKKISDIVSKLYGGALIIEKAGKMNEKTVARLNKAMEHDTGELLIVLEDQRKPLDRLLSSNREFRRKFTSRLEVPVFINDELVTFGQTYAQENGYRIDEMSILALYSRIDSLQREDHAVTIAEVKEIMDEAMAHSQKASAKKLVKRVFGKNTDDSDRIILTEKDFNL